MTARNPVGFLPALEKLRLTEEKKSVEEKGGPALLNLPPEILEHILEYLPDISLHAASLTCKRMQHFAHSDNLWHSLLSRLKLTSHHPYPSYRRLHRALAPHLFLPRKLFLGDRDCHGHVLVCKYMPNTGTIEAFAMIEDKPRSRPSRSSPWSQDPEVRVYSFSPKVRLWEETELKISPDSRRSYSGEIPQPRAARGILATFIRARAFAEEDVHPSMRVWPPIIIPSEERVRNESATRFSGSGHNPNMPALAAAALPPMASIDSVDEANSSVGRITPFDQSPVQSSRRNDKEKWAVRLPVRTGSASEKSFRLRKWTMLGNQQHFSNGRERLRVGERVETYSEVDEELWTPTPEYPYRGIWIGDYAMHGTEFLLFHQPKKETPDSPSPLFAIKLTGDPNVKRGEYSFTCQDVTPASAIRQAPDWEVEWPNALVFPAVGFATRDLEVTNDDFSGHEMEIIVPAKQVLANETQSPTYQPEGRLWHPSASSSPSSVASGSRRTSVDDSRKSDVGSGWGVGRGERTSAPISVATRHAAQRAERKTADWVKREIVVWWKGNALYDMRRFKRVDVDDFFN